METATRSAKGIVSQIITGTQIDGLKQIYFDTFPNGQCKVVDRELTGEVQTIEVSVAVREKKGNSSDSKAEKEQKTNLLADTIADFALSRRDGQLRIPDISASRRVGIGCPGSALILLTVAGHIVCVLKAIGCERTGGHGTFTGIRGVVAVGVDGVV